MSCSILPFVHLKYHVSTASLFSEMFSKSVQMPVCTYLKYQYTITLGEMFITVHTHVVYRTVA